ncbi:MAG: InlB B-repeat-containing protein, partial [Lachnospiraceae bacterium]|nr:InlB B-repeat-containing protein [Lachnospiraceae bacterium]
MIKVLRRTYKLVTLLMLIFLAAFGFSGQAKAAEPTIKVAGTLLSAENPEKKVGDLHFTYDATYKRLTIGGQLAETNANATEGLVELDGVKDLTIYLEKDTSIVTNRSVGFLFMGATDITISSGQNVSLSMNVKEQQWAYMFGGYCSKVIFKNADLAVSVTRTGGVITPTSGSGVDMVYSSVSFVNANVSIECKGSDYDQALYMQDSDITNFGYEKIMPSTVTFDQCKLSDEYYWKYISSQQQGYIMNTGYGTMATSAKVEKLPRKVSFDVNGVTVTAPSTQEVKEGEKAAQPDITPPDGYQFDGWFLEPECVNKYDFSKPVMDDLTLYALWSFEVLFDGNGVTMVKAPSAQKIKRNAVATRPEDPVAKGYLFAGWYQDPEGVYPFDFGEKITKRTVVIAKWTAHEHVMTKVPAKEATTTETGNAE